MLEISEISPGQLWPKGLHGARMLLLRLEPGACRAWDAARVTHHGSCETQTMDGKRKEAFNKDTIMLYIYIYIYLYLYIYNIYLWDQISIDDDDNNIESCV